MALDLPTVDELSLDLDGDNKVCQECATEVG